MKPKLIHFTEELWDVIDSLRNGESRSAWIESMLRRMSAVKNRAKSLDVVFPDRPQRGRYDRSLLRGQPRGTTLKEAKRKRRRKNG